MSRRLFIAMLGTMALAGIAAQRVPAVAVVIEHGTILPSHATARLRVTVDPQKVNRGVWTAIESTAYAAASFEELHGANAPKTRWIEFPDLPDGNYTAWVRLLREHGDTSASTTFIVGHDEELFP